MVGPDHVEEKWDGEEGSRACHVEKMGRRLKAVYLAVEGLIVGPRGRKSGC